MPWGDALRALPLAVILRAVGAAFRIAATLKTQRFTKCIYPSELLIATGVIIDVLSVMNAESLNTSSRDALRRRHWLAWSALCAAVAVHVADEALTDFLSIYNPAVLAMRERNPWLPLLTFTFENWLALLIFAIIALFAASYFVWRGRWAMRPISYVFAGFMLLNGLLHIAGSIYTGTLMPGVYSSPLLLAASAFLITSTRAYSRSREPSVASRL